MKTLREPQASYTQRRPTMADWRKIMISPEESRGTKDTQKVLKEIRGK